MSEIDLKTLYELQSLPFETVKELTLTCLTSLQHRDDTSEQRAEMIMALFNGSIVLAEQYGFNIDLTLSREETVSIQYLS